VNVSEEELIEFIKPILKDKGFRKKAKRWTKITEHFTYMFYIQGSSYDKDAYYVRPGIIINAIKAEPGHYGHFMTDIPVTTKEEILATALEFFSQWSSIAYLKKTVAEFVAWEKRNPVEKRRSGEVDYEADPVPAKCLFYLSGWAKEEILNLAC
jgi:hypothetical protein